MNRERNELINHEVVARKLKLSKESTLYIEVLQEPKTESEREYKRSEDLPDPIGVIVVGTDLREIFILKTKPDDTRPVSPIPEGCGHGDFAARSLEEFELLEYIQDKENLDRVSVERVVSIRGIVRIYQFLQKKYLDLIIKDQELEKIKQIIGNIDDIPETEIADVAFEIVDAALAKHDPLCLKTMEMFSEAYGSEVGNFAVRLLPYEGLYVARRIAAKILHKDNEKKNRLRKIFLKEFNNKGRLDKIVANIPLYLVKNEEVG